MPDIGPRPRIITAASVVLGSLGLLTIEIVRDLLLRAVAWLSVPGPLSRPMLLALFLCGIGLFCSAVIVATIGGLQIVTAARMLRGHGWSRYEAVALSAFGAMLALLEWVVSGTPSGSPGVAHIAFVASIPAYGLVVLAVALNDSWFEPVPPLPWKRDEQAAEADE